MKPQDLVLIDTCIWVPFFNRPQSPIKRAVDELLDEDRAALIGPVLAEILSGIKREPRADYLASCPPEAPPCQPDLGGLANGGKGSIRRKRLTAGWDNGCLEKILFEFPENRLIRSRSSAVVRALQCPRSSTSSSSGFSRI